jgi:hypothetical protein
MALAYNKGRGQHRREKGSFEAIKAYNKGCGILFLSNSWPTSLQFNLDSVWICLSKHREKEEGREKIWLQNYFGIYSLVIFQRKFNSLCYISFQVLPCIWQLLDLCIPGQFFIFNGIVASWHVTSISWCCNLLYFLQHDELKPLTKSFTDSLSELGNLKVNFYYWECNL